MAKLTTAELPKTARANAKTLPDAVVKEAVADLTDSVDYRPHAYTDGTEYPTYSEALSAANVTIRLAADQMGKPRDMFRRKVWDTAQKAGKQDRKKKGKWMFATTQRSTPPKSAQPTESQNGGEPAGDSDTE